MIPTVICLAIIGGVVILTSLLDCKTVVVQNLNSDYALIAGGFGPSYTQMNSIDIVGWDKVYTDVVSEIPFSVDGRYLGSISGLMETLGDASNQHIVFCRLRACWQLDIAHTKHWREVERLNSPNSHSRSTVFGRNSEHMLVVHGGIPNLNDSFISSHFLPREPVYQVYNLNSEKWENPENWEAISGSRRGFCLAPYNATVFAVIGGYEMKYDNNNHDAAHHRSTDNEVFQSETDFERTISLHGKALDNMDLFDTTTGKFISQTDRRVSIIIPICIFSPLQFPGRRWLNEINIREFQLSD